MLHPNSFVRRAKPPGFFAVDELGADAVAPVDASLAPVALCKLGETWQIRRDAFDTFVRAVPDQ